MLGVRRSGVSNELHVIEGLKASGRPVWGMGSMVGDGGAGLKAHDRRAKLEEFAEDIFPAILIGAGDRCHRPADRLKETVEGLSIGTVVAEMLKIIDDLSEDNPPFSKAQGRGTNRDQGVRPPPIHHDTLTGRP